MIELYIRRSVPIPVSNLYGNCFLESLRVLRSGADLALGPRSPSQSPGRARTLGIQVTLFGEGVCSVPLLAHARSLARSLARSVGLVSGRVVDLQPSRVSVQRTVRFGDSVEVRFKEQSLVDAHRACSSFSRRCSARSVILLASSSRAMSA